MSTRALYLRISSSELQRFVLDPKRVHKLDVRPAIDDGRAIDLGRGWEELGCLLEGGITTPEAAPAIGDVPLSSNDREAWSWVRAERVEDLAKRLTRITRAAFYKMYVVDDEETQ